MIGTGWEVLGATATIQWASSILSAGGITEQAPQLLLYEIHHHVCIRASLAMGSPSPRLSVVGMLKQACSRETWDFSKGRLAWWLPSGLAKLFFGLCYGLKYLYSPSLLLPPLFSLLPPSLPLPIHLGSYLHCSLAAILISTSLLSIFSHGIFRNKFITYLILSWYQIIRRSELIPV